MRRSMLLPAGLALVRIVLAQDSIPTCSLDKKCPESAPCCSQYGQCGVGAFCLGGCDPRMSFSLDSCVPAPVCKDRTMRMDSLDGVVDIADYMGDSSKADWVSQGEAVVYEDSLLLTMAPKTVGTVLSSTVYMWYGNVKARLKSSRGNGVVSAFILFSACKDEIDYEWVGADLETTQTNYYFQGIPDYQNSGNISTTNTFSEFHDYEIRWTPDEIVWLVDGKVGRTKKKSETWNETSMSWNYPQSPSRVQLSIWPGGADTNALGTIEWAGGPIDWTNHPDIKSVGYYYAAVESVTIECYKTDSAPGTSSGISYTYSDARGTNDTIVDGDKPTILKSMLGTGTDMDAGDTDGQDGDGNNNDKDKPPSAQIPGGSMNGPGLTPADSSNPNSNSGSPGSTSCNSNSFSQDCGGGGGDGDGDGGNGDNASSGERATRLGSGEASVFAVMVALAGLGLM